MIALDVLQAHSCNRTIAASVKNYLDDPSPERFGIIKEAYFRTVNSRTAHVFDRLVENSKIDLEILDQAIEAPLLHMIERIKADHAKKTYVWFRHYLSVPLDALCSLVFERAKLLPKPIPVLDRRSYLSVVEGRDHS